MKSSAKNNQMTAFEGLRTGGPPMEAGGKGNVQEIPLSELFPFKGHPFKVLDIAVHHEQYCFIIVQFPHDHRHRSFPCQFRSMSAPVPGNQFIASLCSRPYNAGDKDCLLYTSPSPRDCS